jgi:hypothetical protein
MEWKASPEQRKLRLALMAPFIAIILAALVLVVAAFNAWGAAQDVGYPDSAPTIGGLIFTIPTLVAASFFARQVWLRTFQPYRLKPWRLALGLAAVLGGLALTVAYAFLVGDPESYHGAIDPVTKEWTPNFTLDWFFILTVTMAIFFPMAGVWFFAKVAYLDAIEPLGRAEVQGPDAIGQLMRESSLR